MGDPANVDKLSIQFGRWRNSDVIFVKSCVQISDIMMWNKAVLFCLEAAFDKRLQIWRHNYVIDRNKYLMFNVDEICNSSSTFTGIFV